MTQDFNTEERVSLPTQGQVSEAWERARGEELVRVLRLRPAIPQCGERWTEPRYILSEYGSKTALGVFRTIKRIVEGA